MLIWVPWILVTVGQPSYKETLWHVWGIYRLPDELVFLFEKWYLPWLTIYSGFDDSWETTGSSMCVVTLMTCLDCDQLSLEVNEFDDCQDAIDLFNSKHVILNYHPGLQYLDFFLFCFVLLLYMSWEMCLSCFFLFWNNIG